MVLRIAMWSGPRNISTAMMRAWGNRPDTTVCDEPLYAHYLEQTQLPHPGRDEVIAHHETDWRQVVQWLIGPLPPGKEVFYQKQMSHHLLPNIELDWIPQLANCFLIRDPREMLVSLTEFIPQPTLSDTGLPQQWKLFELVQQQTGETPIVLDAQDVLRDPRGILTTCCQRLGIEFREEMLSWPAGRRATDGIWAKYWYAKVEQTTSFGPPTEKEVTIPNYLVKLLAECQSIYQRLHVHRMIATNDMQMNRG